MFLHIEHFVQIACAAQECENNRKKLCHVMETNICQRELEWGKSCQNVAKPEAGISLGGRSLVAGYNELLKTCTWCAKIRNHLLHSFAK